MADRQLERRLAQGWQARIMHMRGFAPGSFGGFEGAEETTSFNVFARRVMDTPGAVWCCRCVSRELVCACSRLLVLHGAHANAVWAC